MKGAKGYAILSVFREAPGQDRLLVGSIRKLEQKENRTFFQICEEVLSLQAINKMCYQKSTHKKETNNTSNFQIKKKGTQKEQDEMKAEIQTQKKKIAAEYSVQ